MSAGRWFRCDLWAWDMMIEEVRADGKPLPIPVATMDLRRHAYSPLTSRAYADRWGWHRSRVRRLIKLEKWRDPYSKTPTTNRPPTDHQQAQAVRSGAGSTNKTDHQPTTKRPLTDPPLYRESISISMSKDVGSESKQPDPFDQAVDLWKQHKPKGARMVKGKGAGRLLAARLKDHGFEAVRAVMLWGLTSEHRQADWLRQNGYCRISTLCNATKFEAYLEASKEQTTDRGEWVDHGNDERGPLPF